MSCIIYFCTDNLCPWTESINSFIRICPECGKAVIKTFDEVQEPTDVEI